MLKHLWGLQSENKSSIFPFHGGMCWRLSGAGWWLSHPRGARTTHKESEPPNAFIPIPLAKGYLAGDPNSDMDSKKQRLGAKNRVKKGKKHGGEEMCRSKGKVENLCHEAGTS